MESIKHLGTQTLELKQEKLSRMFIMILILNVLGNILSFNIEFIFLVIFKDNKYKNKSLLY